MEARFGHNFSQVRVHADARAAESAHATNALAYTVGHDIVFGAGQYGPHSTTGQHLLAHELAHVVQQQHATTNVAPGSSHEHEADAAAEAVARPGTPVRVKSASAVGLARQPDDKPTVAGPTIRLEIRHRLYRGLLTARQQALVSSSIRQEANRAFAIAAIISPQGSV